MSINLSRPASAGMRDVELEFDAPSESYLRMAAPGRHDAMTSFELV